VNIRTSGERWLREHGRETKERRAFSKYYAAKESWTRTPVWWFRFAERYAIEEPDQFMNLLCEIPGGSDFRHLRVPMSYFLEHRDGIWCQDDSFSPHLSAERPSLFREMRGDGRIEFADFELK
jgi:hypothetical protein